MGMVLACFRCGNKPPHHRLLARASPPPPLPRRPNHYDVAENAGSVRANSVLIHAQNSNGAKREVGKNIPAANHEVEKKSVATAINADGTHRPVGKYSPDPRSKVDELQEELESLRKKLAHEADEAKKLRSEVRYLKTCGELLESPTKFKQALDDLGKDVPGQGERYQHSWLFTEIQPDGNSTEVRPSQPSSSKSSSENRATDVSAFAADPNGDGLISAEPSPFNSDEEEELSATDCLTNGIRKDGNPERAAEEYDTRKTQTDGAIRRLPSPTSSAKLIRETDLSSGDIEETSKSLFAFSPNSATQSCHSVSYASASDGQAASVSEESLSNTDSELDSQSYRALSHARSTHGSGNDSAPRSPRRTWNFTKKGIIETETSSSSSAEDSIQNENHAHAWNVHPSGTHSSWQQQRKMNASVDDSDQFWDALSYLSTDCSDKRNDFSGGSLGTDEGMASDQASLYSDASSSEPSSLGVLQVPPSKDGSFARRNVGSQVLIPKENAVSLKEDETAFEWKRMTLKSRTLVETMARERQEVSGHELESADTQECSISTDKMVYEQQSSVPTEKTESQEERVMDSESADSYVESEIHIPNRALEGTNRRDSADLQDLETSLSEWIKPETSNESTSKQEQTPSLSTSGSYYEVTSKPPPVSTSASSGQGTSHQVQISSTATSASSPQGPCSLAKLADDRPILGTVAAHWSDSSSCSSKRKWWDGKGIPNSTNKYKEDQKVSWHAIPFEVRLEQALAEQGSVSQN